MNDSELQDLITDSTWLRGLALRLADQTADAEDLVQATLVAALEEPSERTTSPRGWMARVLKFRAARLHRQRKRRAAREQKAAHAEAVDSTDAIVARLELQREITTLVMDLPKDARSVVLLRFFEDLPPRAIALRLDLPVETVRTRLRRALARLRESMDARFGDRNTWIALLLVRFGDTTAVTSTAVATGSAVKQYFGVATLQTSRTVLTTSLIILSLAITTVWIRFAANRDDTSVVTASSTSRLDPRAAADDETGSATVPSPKPLGIDTSRHLIAADDDQTDDSPPTASATSDSATQSQRAIRGRVIDTEGEPIAGIAVHWAGPHAIRYADSLETWLGNGGRNSVEWTPELQNRLETDSLFATAFFAELTDPDEWRASLLGVVQEGRGTHTANDGTFTLALAASSPTTGRVVVVQKGMRSIAEGVDDRGRAVWVAAPVVTISGRVLDAEERPFANARLTVHPGFDLRALPIRVQESRPPATVTATCDASGNYVLREICALTSTRIDVAHESAHDLSVPVPTHSQQDFHMRLDLRDPTPRSLRIEGIVVDSGSQPVAGADVFCGEIRSRTNSAGSFSIEIPFGGAPRSLIAVARGYLPAILDGFTATLASRSDRVTELEVRLPGLASSISGRLRDSRGAALSGVAINLFDPTLPDTSFSSLEMLSAGRRELTTDSDGSFRLDGLMPRSYRLRIWSVDRLIAHVTDPIPAGITDTDIVVPDLPILAPAIGRVRDRDGLAVPDVRVAFGFTTFQPRSGWEGHHGPASTTDSDGNFTLDVLPLRHVFLEVRGESILPMRVPVEELEDPRRPELRVERACALTLRDGSTQPATLRALDSRGGALRFLANGEMADSYELAADAGWPAIAVSIATRSLEFTTQSARVVRVAIDPDPAATTAVVVAR